MQLLDLRLEYDREIGAIHVDKKDGREPCVKGAAERFLLNPGTHLSLSVSPSAVMRGETVRGVGVSSSSAESHIITPDSFCVAAPLASAVKNSRFEGCGGQRDANHPTACLVEDAGASVLSVGYTSRPPPASLHLLYKVSTHLAVVQLAELLDDPLLQHESFPQLFPVVLDRHFALSLLHRVVPGGDGAGPHAAHTGRRLEEDAAAGGRQRGAGLCAGGRHCGEKKMRIFRR